MSWKGVFASSFPKDTLQKYIVANEGIANSTVFQGTLYELTVVRELMNKLRLEDMQVVGGSYDGGIDIRGKWNVLPLTKAIETQIQFDELPKRLKLPTTSIKPWKHRAKPDKYLDCYIQCKAFNSDKVTGRQVRELIGSFSMQVPARKRNSSIMIMSSPTLFTKDGIRLFNEATIPMVFTKVDMIQRLADGSFDVKNSGKLQHYYENDYASKLLANCGIKEWLKLKGYESLGQK
ncbi:Rrg7 [Kluyveromyces lactis]|nr:Rrg7 [Kluyveromyces lactis]